MKKGERVYETDELLEIMIIIRLWRMGMNQGEIAKFLRIDLSRVSRTAKKLEKFKKRKRGW